MIRHPLQTVRPTPARLLGTAMLALFWVAPLAAGIIRDDKADALYTALAAQSRYAGVGDLIIDNSVRCSATVIDAHWILTAAHCVDGGIGQVRFTVGGSTYAASSWVVNANWTTDLYAGWDIALVEFATTITGVTIAPLYTGTAEVGKVGTNVGFGMTGTGLTGATLASGTKRAGENLISAVGGQSDVGSFSSRILFQDFDNPHSAASSWWPSATPLGLEYLIAPGDSGGGLFIDVDGVSYLAGVHSFGLTTAPTVKFVYGDVAGSTRVSSFIDWIEGYINPVPAPATLPLLVVGLLLIGSQTRRRPTHPTFA